MSGFVHLHAHSCYSMMWGIPFPDELCRTAVEKGMNTLAQTDTNGLYGLLWFLEAAKKRNLRPIVGAELRHDERAVLLAKSWEGYRQICRLLTEKHMDPDFQAGPALSSLSEDVFVLTDSYPLLQKLAGRETVFAELLPGAANHRLALHAKKCNLKTVATAGACLAHDGQAPIHRLLRAIYHNTTLPDVPQNDVAPSNRQLYGKVEMHRLFETFPEAVHNASRIAGQCQTRWTFSETIFPAFEASRHEDAFALLKEKCLAGIPKRYGKASPAVMDRLNHELAIIEHKRFADIFLIVADVVAQSSLTCGRGSAAASIVSYLLEITHVDPIRHNLFFERFLNLNRKDPPDIDVDFAWDERDDMLDYVFKKYGGDKTAMVANHACFRARSSIREIAKVYGIPDGEIGRVTKRMSGLWYSFGGNTKELIEHHPMFKGLDLPDPWSEILSIAAFLEGRPRNLSVHCGGVVAVPDHIGNHVPIQPAPKGVPIVQWEKDQTEDAGLVKIDILGNRSLAVIRDALKAIKQQGGPNIRYRDLNPIDDPEVIDMIARGETMGVFYVESPATRQLQQKAGVGDFEHLVIHSSIIRPAANVFIREYVRRLHGGEYEPLHPVMNEILAETYGIMVYQEDVSKIAIALADFDPADADGLRKIMSKKSKDKLSQYQRMFYAGALKKGVTREVIDGIWDMILSFSGYSFCKPHSASYALVSFKSAWIRCHYPAQFIAAVISNQGGYYSPFAYVSEARRMGLEVLPPCINQSEKKYTGQDKWVRVGLMQLAGLNDACIDKLLDDRNRRGAFVSFNDFLHRVNPDPSDAKILVRAGCFDALCPDRSRPELIWEVHRWAHSRQSTKGKNLDLFAQSTPSEPAPKIRPYDERTILRHEVQTLGFLVSRHPLTLYEDKIARLSRIKAKDLKHYAGKHVTVIGWYVTGKVVSTKHAEPMEFISFEDTTAIFETVFFPKVYTRYCHLLTHARPFVLQGIVDEDFGAVALRVLHIRPLD